MNSSTKLGVRRAVSKKKKKKKLPPTRLHLLEALYRKLPRCKWDKCKCKATRATLSNGERCDKHAKGWVTTALPWGYVVRALEQFKR